MHYRHFFVSIRHPQSGEDALNAFLSSNVALEVCREFVADGAASGWCYAVSLDRVTAGTNERGDAVSARKRVDYAEVLDADDFAVFAKLRERRNALADKAGVPGYAVFSNAQLADMATKRIVTESGLRALDGVGAKRVEQYGSEILELMRTLISEER